MMSSCPSSRLGRWRRAPGYAVWGMVVGVLMMSTSSCVTHTTAASQRYHAAAPSEFPPLWWPGRSLEDLDRISLDGPRVVREFDPEIGAVRPVARIATSVPVAQGLVQAVRLIDEDGHLEEPDEPPTLRFTTVRGAPDDPIDELSGDGFGFWFRSPMGGSASALAVHVTTGDVEEMEAVEDALLDQGIAVARITAPPLASRRLVTSVSEDTDLEALSRRIADHVDQALADRAYAIEGVVRYADERHPGFSPGPLIFMGAGEGALALSAAAIRLQGRVRSILYVGGSANVLELALTSEEMDLGIDVEGWADRLSDASKRWLLDLYMANTRLDPYRTAPYVVHTPVVCVVGQWDDHVPNPVSALLWDRLMRPDRFRVLGDHEDVLEEAEERAEWLGAWLAATL